MRQELQAMDIRHLRTFVTVARLGSVTRAAEVLHITQPAVSGQIKTLEEGLEVRLLSRTTTSVTLTPAGEALLRKAEASIEAFGDFVHSAKSFRGRTAGRLRLGVPMLDARMLRVEELLAGMMSAHPTIRVDLQVGRISWLLGALRSAELDASLFVCKGFPQGIRGMVLRPLRYRVAAPAAWRERLAGGTWRDAEQLPWVRMTPHSAHRELQNELFERARIRPVETAETDHEALVAAMVAAGVGMALLRDEIAAAGEAEGRLTAFGDLAIETTLSVLYPADRAADPVMGALLEVLKGCWPA